MNRGLLKQRLNRAGSLVRSSLKGLAILTGSSLLLVSVCVSILPSIVSTDKVKHVINSQVSRQLGRPFHLETLQWGWLSGFHIKNITLEENANIGDAPLLELAEFSLNLGLDSVFPPKPLLEVILTGAQLRLHRFEDGSTNLDRLLKTSLEQTPSPSKKKNEQPQTEKNSSNGLPRIPNVKLKINLDNIQVSLQDQGLKKQIQLNEMFFKLDIPDLYHQPAHLLMGLSPTVNAQSLEKVYLELTSASPFNKHQELDLNQAKVQMDLAIPGGHWRLETQLDPLLNSQLHLDFSRLLAAASSFMPLETLPLHVTGGLDFISQVKGDPAKALQFKSEISLRKIQITGGPLKDKKVGPIRVVLNNQGVFQIASKTLTLEQGHLELLEHSRIHWTGQLENLGSDQQRVSVALGIKIPFVEWFNLAKPLLPPELEQQLKLDGQSQLVVTNLGISLPPDMETAHVTLKNFELSIPRMEFQQADQYMDIHQLALSLDSADIQAGLRDQSAVVKLSALNMGLERLETSADVEKTVAIRQFSLSLDSTNIQTSIKNQSAVIELAPLKLGINHLEFPFSLEKTVPDRLQIGPLRMSLAVQPINLVKFFPQTLNSELSLSLSQIRLKKDSVVFLEGLKLSPLTVNLSQLKINPKAQFGLNANVFFTQDLSIKTLQMPKLIKINSLNQSLNLRVNLEQQTRIQVPKFNVSILALHWQEPALTVPQITLNLSTPRIQLQNMNPLIIDMDKQRLELSIGQGLQLSLLSEIRQTGQESVTHEGLMTLNLPQLWPLIPKELLPPLVALQGDVSINWLLRGRAPSDEELQRLSESGQNSLALLEGSQFLEHVEAGLSFNHIKTQLDLGKTGTIKIQNLSTQKPLKIVLKEGVKLIDLGGHIRIDGLQLSPDLWDGDALDMDLYLTGKQSQLNQLHIEQRLSLSPLQLDQRLELNLKGLTRLLKAPEQWQSAVKAKAIIDVKLGSSPTSVIKLDGINLTGHTGFNVLLQNQPDNMVGGEFNWLTPDLSIEVDERVAVDHLKTRLSLAKYYQIRLEEPSQTPALQALSQQVLSDELKITQSSALNRRHLAGLGIAERSMPSLSIKKVTLKGEPPLPLSVNYPRFDFYLNHGLPVLENLQVTLLGGSVLGSFRLLRQKKHYFQHTKMDFSGIDAHHLVSMDRLSDEDKALDAEVSGRLELRHQLTDDLVVFLNSLMLNLHVSHIGAHTLERLLYSLDPYESNEMILQQRAQLGYGAPKWVQITIRNGYLSITGEVEAGGITIGLPPLKRLDLSNIPGILNLESALKTLGPALKLLPILSADTMQSSKDGNTTFLHIREH